MLTATWHGAVGFPTILFVENETYIREWKWTDFWLCKFASCSSPAPSAFHGGKNHGCLSGLSKTFTGHVLEICVSLLSQESSQSSSSAWDTDLFCLVKWDHGVLLILPKNGGGKGTSWWYRSVETTRVRTMGKDACTPVTMEQTLSGSNCAIRRNSQLRVHTLDLCHLTFFSSISVGLIFIWNKPPQTTFYRF